MNFSDPVANMLSIIRNANMAGHRSVRFPYSHFKEKICEKMKSNLFFSDYWIDECKKVIKAKIRYCNSFSKINSLKKISKPSQSIYVKSKDIPVKCRRFGTYFISTSSGIMTHREAAEKGIGGKLIFVIN